MSGGDGMLLASMISDHAISDPNSGLVRSSVAMAMHAERKKIDDAKILGTADFLAMGIPAGDFESAVV